MIVSFCGHREVTNPQYIRQQLETIVASVILEGADTFFLGGYGQFDQIAAQVVHHAKSYAPDIRSVLIIPYQNRSYCTEFCDETLYPCLENVPPRYAISKRNEYMVNESNLMIAYITHTWGGAYQTYLYAKRKKKRILLLNDTGRDPFLR